jgi:hypothetical protein
VWTSNDRNVGKYSFSDNGQFLFMEWISDDAIVRGEKPSYYVLERGKFPENLADAPSRNVSGRGKGRNDSAHDLALISLVTNCECAFLESTVFLVYSLSTLCWCELA